MKTLMIFRLLLAAKKRLETNFPVLQVVLEGEGELTKAAHLAEEGIVKDLLTNLQMNGKTNTILPKVGAIIKGLAMIPLAKGLAIKVAMLPKSGLTKKEAIHL